MNKVQSKKVDCLLSSLLAIVTLIDVLKHVNLSLYHLLCMHIFHDVFNLSWQQDILCNSDELFSFNSTPRVGVICYTKTFSDERIQRHFLSLNITWLIASYEFLTFIYIHLFRNANHKMKKLT